MFQKHLYNILFTVCLYIIVISMCIYKNIHNAKYFALSISEQLSTPAPFSMYIQYRIVFIFILIITIMQFLLTIGNIKLNINNK